MSTLTFRPALLTLDNLPLSTLELATWYLTVPTPTVVHRVRDLATPVGTYLSLPEWVKLVAIHDTARVGIPASAFLGIV